MFDNCFFTISNETCMYVQNLFKYIHMYIHTYIHIHMYENMNMRYVKKFQNVYALVTNRRQIQANIAYRGEGGERRKYDMRASFSIDLNEA